MIKPIFPNRNGKVAKSEGSMGSHRVKLLIRGALSLFIILTIVFGIQIGSIDTPLSSPINDGTSCDAENPNGISTVPRASGYNTRLYLNGTEPINQSHTLTGEWLLLRGYVEWYNSASTSWQRRNGLKVYPIIDGISYDGINQAGHSTENLTVLSETKWGDDGVFEIPIHVPVDYDYTSDMGLLANITEEPAKSIYVNQNTVQDSTIYHDITTRTVMTVTTDRDDLITTPDDPLLVTFNVTDLAGRPLSSVITSGQIALFRNGNVSDVNATGLSTVADTGIGTYTVYDRKDGWTSVGCIFYNTTQKTVGSETYYEYEQSFDWTPINRLASCKILNSSIKIINVDNTSADMSQAGNQGSYTQIVYPSGNVRVMAELLLNDSRDLAYMLEGHYLYVYINDNGVPFRNVQINSTGGIDFTFNLQNDAGFTDTNTTFTLTFEIDDYDPTLVSNDNAVMSIVKGEVHDPYPVPTPPPVIPTANNSNIAAVQVSWGKIFIPIGAVAGAIIGLVIFQRKRMDIMAKRNALYRAVDKPGRMVIIESLCNAGKWREAIAYTYKIYSDLIYEKYGAKRKPSQTLREFAIRCVKTYGMDPLHVYPYVSLVESIIYGNFRVDKDTFDKAMELFGKIFQDITGSVMLYNLKYEDNSLKNLEITIQEQ